MSRLNQPGESDDHPPNLPRNRHRVRCDCTRIRVRMVRWMACIVSAVQKWCVPGHSPYSVWANDGSLQIASCRWLDGNGEIADECAPNDEAHANALLIAAAPDLLAALEAAKRKHHVCEDCWYSCPASGECCDDAESDQCNCGAEQHNAAIDAAIAKARGQS